MEVDRRCCLGCRRAAAAERWAGRAGGRASPLLQTSLQGGREGRLPGGWRARRRRQVRPVLFSGVDAPPLQKIERDEKGWERDWVRRGIGEKPKKELHGASVERGSRWSGPNSRMSSDVEA